MNYDPQPIDTSAIDLPEGVAALVEKLAENTHDVWAQQRRSQGWTYGPQREDAAKKHPGLVPYADLTEEEKEYDRNTAVQTLKLIIALGYRLQRTPKRK